MGSRAVDQSAVDILRAEADADAAAAAMPPAGADASSSSAGAGELPEPDPAMASLCHMLVKTGGRIVCARLRVSDLADQEAKDMGHAFGVFCKVWGVSIGDPRVASIILLAGTGAAIALPRMEEFERNKAAAAAAMADGQTGPSAEAR